MSQSGGEWGSAVFGGSLFGYAQSRVIGEGLLINAATVAALNQTEDVHLDISLTVYIDGVDRTAYIERVSGASDGDFVAARASIVFIGSGLTWLTKFAEVIIDETIIVGDQTYTVRLFNGQITLISEAEGAESQSTSVEAYDASYFALKAPPTSTTWTGLASDLIALEAQYAGLDVDVQIRDVTLTDVAINHSSRIALFKALAGVYGRAMVHLSASGRLVIRTIEYSQLRRLGWAVPLSAQWKQQPVDSSRDHFNRVTVQGANGSTTTIDDTADQAVNGIIEGSSIYAPYISDVPGLTDKGTNTMNEARLQRMYWGTVLHPFIRSGDVLADFARTDGTKIDEILVEGISTWSYSKNAGGWAEYRGVEV